MPTTTALTIGIYRNLRGLAEMFEDHQKNRMAQSNRVRSLQVVEHEYKPFIDRLMEIEKELSRKLTDEYHVVAPPGVVAWEEETLGVGAHTLARLLGHLGHPRLAEPKYWEENPGLAENEFGDQDNPRKALHDGEPFERTVGQLWQYCGHGRAERYRKGMTQEEAFQLGNPRCKMLTHLIAEGIIKAQIRKLDDGSREASGDLGEFYLAEKLKYADRVHSGPCSGGYVPAGPGKVVFAKCKTGADGAYAITGDPYTDGHINSIAMRHLGKEILKELWIAAE